MSAYLNINEQLLQHYKYGTGAAEYIRKAAPGFTNSLSRFLAARSDVKRLQEADKLTTLILGLRDLQDTLELRKFVTTLELKRKIKYDKQKDHTTHTLYLFLFGIWVYDHVNIVRDSINKHITTERLESKIKMFVFQWIYASLLHDVGYLFFETKNRSALNFYDKMFSSKRILSFLGSSDRNLVNDVDQVWGTFLDDYKCWEYSKAQLSAQCILEYLRKISWLEIFEEYKGKSDGLKMLLMDSDSDKKLIQFAELVAQQGYPKSKKKNDTKVDHAVASGLMLLQYTSVWYWLYKKIENEYPESFEKLKNLKFIYDIEIFENHIIPACRAVVYHSIHQINEFKGCSFPPVNLEEEPLLYLAILCDELQIWDRFPAGSKNVSMWSKDFQIMAEDILADFEINNEGALSVSLKLIDLAKTNDIIKGLDQRLSNWRQIVEINKYTTSTK